MNVDYSAAVERGHEWMAENYPADLAAMRGHIARSGEFDMRQPSTCMLRTIGYNSTEREHGHAWMADHGFKIDDNDDLNDTFNYPELEKLWKAVLA